MEWVHICGWAFVAWHDLFQIEEVPLGLGCINHKVRQIALRGNMEDKMNEFVPGIVWDQE